MDITGIDTVNVDYNPYSYGDERNATKGYDWKTSPAEYVPQSRRTFADADPQRNPEWFTSKDLKKEISTLLRMNKKYGTHPLRVEAYMKLDKIISERGE